MVRILERHSGTLEGHSEAHTRKAEQEAMAKVRKTVTA